MATPSAGTVRAFFLSMGVYWMGFGLITVFYPPLMDLFQSAEGIAAGTDFSDHVWMHGGLDILSLVVVLFALSTLPPHRTTLLAAAAAALGPTLAIGYSLVATPYWNPLFIGSGLGCAGFAAWGFWLASRA